MEIVKSKPNQDIIDLLRGILEDAENGKIQGIAIAGSTGDGCTFNCFEVGKHGQVLALMGEIHVLSRDFMDCCIALRRSPLPEYCE